MSYIYNFIDYIYKARNQDRIETFIVLLAALSLVLHISVILLVQTGVINYPPLENVSILTALSTPFTVILLYEIFLVIAAIAVSIPDSVSRQYQTVSLIVMRNLFKDIAILGSDLLDPSTFSQYQLIFIGMGTTIVLFLFVLLFMRLLFKLGQEHADLESKYVGFNKIKKLTSLVALLTFIGLFGYEIFSNLFSFGLFEMWFKVNFDLLFQNLFLVLIVLDVFLIIVSTIFQEDYSLIVRNGSLVFSSILIRLSVTAERPVNNLFALIGMIFGLIVYALYVKYVEMEDKYQSVEQKVR